MSAESFIAQNLQKVHARLNQACRSAGRAPQSVALIAVGKTVPLEILKQAATVGQRDFGENYLQEALPKIAALQAAELRWHFLGPVQSNKCGDIARHFDWVHTVDRFKIAQRLSQLRPPEQPVLDVCVQVNISGETSKSGVAADQALVLCRQIAALPRLKLRGLMAIPAPAEKQIPRTAYRHLHELMSILQGSGLDLDTLSAGMSDDLEDAVAEGSTMVRIGTAIFGKRQP